MLPHRILTFNEVETIKDLCTMRYMQFNIKQSLLVCSFKVCRASRPSYLDRVHKQVILYTLILSNPSFTTVLGENFQKWIKCEIANTGHGNWSNMHALAICMLLLICSIYYSVEK